MQESDYTIEAKNVPRIFSQVMSSKESNCGKILWRMGWIIWHQTKSRISSSFLMVWHPLYENGYLNKRDSQYKIERHKEKNVAKRFTQRQRIDYTETFSPISKKYFLLSD